MAWFKQTSTSVMKSEFNWMPIIQFHSDLILKLVWLKFKPIPEINQTIHVVQWNHQSIQSGLAFMNQTEFKFISAMN